MIAPFARFAILFALLLETAACGSPAATTADAGDDVAADAADASADATADVSADVTADTGSVTNPADYADPRLGSGGYAFAFGSAFPGASSPSGMMRVGPDTSGPYGTVSFLHFSGYWAGDDTIRAFSHLHLHGTGATDYGALGILPVPAFDPKKLRVEDYASTFAKSSEIASPGFYSVVLDNGPITAEFTTGIHSARERFTFPAGSKSGTLIVDPSHSLSKVITSSVSLDGKNRTLSGSLQSSGGMSGGYKLYFTLHFASPWTASRGWDAEHAPADVTAVTGAGVGVALDFDVSGAPVEVEVGLSLLSAAGAEANVSAEIGTAGFAPTKQAAELAWNQRLQTLTVHGGTEDQRRMFYSSLHHAFVMPGIYSDGDGTFTYSGQTAHADGYRFLNDISGWDIYRSLFPLYALVAPDLALDMVKSMHGMAKISGNFPKWSLAASEAGTMIGAAADVMISEAYVKGIQQFDVADVYKRLRDAALEANLPPGEGRGGRDHFEHYAASSYVYYGDGPAVSLTCELNQDDFALAQFAAALGKTDDAKALLQRSQGFKKLYDPTTGFLRVHDEKGVIPDDNFTDVDFGLAHEYDEADAYQTEFCAQFDPDTMAQMWGGKAKLVAALEDLFEKSKVERAAALETVTSEGDPNGFLTNLPPKYYFGGNEPDIHYPWLFARLGRPDLTAKWVTWAMATYFANGPTGIPGNDDGGTMTAWYVFGALGLYPVPGSDLYIVGSPQFPQVDIQVQGGQFVITAQDVSAQNIYVQSAKLNGKPLDTATLHHADLHAGGSLELQMGAQPSAWAKSP